LHGLAKLDMTAAGFQSAGLKVDQDKAAYWAKGDADRLMTAIWTQRHAWLDDRAGQCSILA